MIILFFLFLVQFSIACACLAVNSSQQEQLARQGWASSTVEFKEQIQEAFQCCGFDNHTEPLDLSSMCNSKVFNFLQNFTIEDWLLKINYRSYTKYCENWFLTRLVSVLLLQIRK